MPLLTDALELSRWQFATTTLYHFIFVPLTLGLAPLLAVMQTRWYRTRARRTLTSSIYPPWQLILIDSRPIRIIAVRPTQAARPLLCIW